jgi:hypothetical protein
VTFTRNENDIIRASGADGKFNGLSSIRLDFGSIGVGILEARHYFANYIFGPFGTGIITGDDYIVRQFFGNPSHTRPLGAVPVTPTAENNRQRAFA